MAMHGTPLFIIRDRLFTVELPITDPPRSGQSLYNR